MTLRLPGAGYINREHITDPKLRDALDDVANQAQSGLLQGNFGKNGQAVVPSAPTAIRVTLSAGVYTATLIHNEPPKGVRYRLQYSTTPNFLSPIEVDLGQAKTWQQYLPTQGRYFRYAAQTLASDLSEWVYFGGQATPTQV